jgi:hypothetical protein
MKNLTRFVMAMIIVAVFSEFANAQKLPPLDPSPADIAWLPANRKDPVIRVIYGRPQKKGRTMLGGVEPYGKVWRLGANEATEIKLYKDVTFGDKKVPAGTYTLYAIPNKDEWTLIVNSKLDTWGAYSYEESKDVARIKVPAGTSDAEVEAFTIAFDGADGTGKMAIAWEKTLVTVPLKY